MEKGFLGSLFDLSFTSFVTTKLVKVLYVLSLVILGIAYVAIAIALFSSGGTTSVGADGTLQQSGGDTGLGLLWLFVLGPLFLFFYTLLYRVFFELVVVLFRIFENTRDQLSVVRAAWPAADDPPPPAPSLGPPAAPAQPL